MNDYYEVQISAEDQTQADIILDDLLRKRLITGGQFIKTPARFLWKNEIVNMKYLTITSFTLAKHREAITQSIEKTSAEDVPMIRFVAIEANSKLQTWIKETVA